MAKVSEMNMTEGSLIRKMTVFVIPIMITSVLQMLFNAADMMVVGSFVGARALAAVGACSSLINLLVTLFTGVASACNITVATYYGAGSRERISKVLHTAMVVAVAGGIIMLLLGWGVAPQCLELMSTPEDVLDAAVLYIRIYFISMPAMLVYNYGAAVLRALGDSKRPLYYLIVSGVLNLALNVLMVVGFRLEVAGVAIATTVSQYVVAGLLIVYLMKIDGEYRLRFSKLRIDGHEFVELMRLGIPAGIQGMMFSISNVVIQSSINSFGSDIVAACSAVSNIEGIVYVTLSAVSQATMSFTAQNAGAGKRDRVKKVVGIGLIGTAVLGVLMSVALWFVGEPILHLYTSDATVLAEGAYRIHVVCFFYLFCGVMDVFAGCIRGLGYSMLPTVVTLLGACGLRMLWIFTVFAADRTLFRLYMAYPVSWTVTALAHGICLLIIWKGWKKDGN